MPHRRFRFTAFRATVADLKKGVYNKDHVGHLVTSPDGVVIRRAIIAGLVIDTFSTNNRMYAILTVDDTTGHIRVRGWGKEAVMLSEISNNVFVRVMGRVRRWEDEIYLNPDHVTVFDDSEWIALHLLERARGIKFYLRDREILGARTSVKQDDNAILGQS